MSGTAQAGEASLTVASHDLSLELLGLPHSMAVSGKLDSLYGIWLPPVCAL